LALVQSLLATLPARARSLRPGGAGNELALLAAVHGMQEVPADLFPFVAASRHEERHERGTKDATGGSSCGSVVITCGASGSGGASCGSSGGGGCGSSCGGGGCGGCGS
jgi:hypothetical protein